MLIILIQIHETFTLVKLISNRGLYREFYIPNTINHTLILRQVNI